MNKLLLPFYKISLFIIARTSIGSGKGGDGRMEERLRLLCLGQERISVQEYYARRIAVVLAVLFWGLGLSLLLEAALYQEEKKILIEQLQRPDYGKGERETKLEVSIQGETEKSLIPIRISEQTYTAEEIQRIFGKVMEGLDVLILGENKSPNEVRTNLTLPKTAYNGVVSIEWILSPLDVLDDSGTIIKEVGTEGEVVELKALLRYEKQEAEYTSFVHVYPPLRTAAEKLMTALEEELARADEVGKHEETLVLPSEIEGKKVSWSVPKESLGTVLAVGIVLIALLLYIQQDKKLDKLEAERKKQMILDYPELLFKLAMLLGAGLTIKGAFLKIASEYQNRNAKKQRYVYEELILTCREMEHGVGEAAAYENFGKRCQESRYVKLGSVLSQNLKKGAKGLQELLEQEAAAGFEERKSIARKLGEEAGTKLLIPMMLMLVLVLVILMVPAVISF